MKRKTISLSSRKRINIQIEELFTGTRIPKRAIREIVELYAEAALFRIKENPYHLIDKVRGIGFVSADKVALKVGFDPESEFRIRAGIFYILGTVVPQLGHTCFPIRLLILEAEKILNISREKIESIIQEFIKEKQLYLKEEKFIYLPRIYEREKYISQKLKELSGFEALNCRNIDTEGLAEDQIKALSLIACHRVSVLTGAPGTGKTYTVKKILSSFEDTTKGRNKDKIKLAAPSGKAAKRLAEVTGKKAVTIHRLLEPEVKKYGGYRFTRDENNPLKCDILILDEASMIDVFLLSSVLKALKKGTRLIFVGDHYQLPSVGAGNILRDIISSEKIPVAELKEIKRQKEGEESLIVRNCHRVKDGLSLEYQREETGKKDFFFQNVRDEEDIQQTVIGLVKRLEKAYHLNFLSDIQILSPLKDKTLLSCKALNEECQRRLNPNPEIKGNVYKIGDKVIQTKNDYELNIINGDTGIVEEIDIEREIISICFENPERKIKLPLYKNDLVLAYALTIHKSQGSEWPAVIIPVHERLGGFLMDRNLLYTALSRAQVVCVLVGQKKEIDKMIKRDRAIKRFTGLSDFLRG